MHDPSPKDDEVNLFYPLPGRDSAKSGLVIESHHLRVSVEYSTVNVQVGAR